MSRLCKGGDGLCEKEAEADGFCDDHHPGPRVIDLMEELRKSLKRDAAPPPVKASGGECEECRGTGEIKESDRGGVYDCRDCGGTGKRPVKASGGDKEQP
jgi:hypothetical protein